MHCLAYPVPNDKPFNTLTLHFEDTDINVKCCNFFIMPGEREGKLEACDKYSL